MKDDNGIILPVPRTKNGVEFNELPGPALGFKFTLESEEYVTIAQAAKMLGISKEQMREMVEARGIKKHDETKQGYYLLSKNDIELIKYNAY
jgi:hypothetical protein